MNTLKKIVLSSNKFFAAGILAVFYVFVIGFSFLMLKLRDLASEKKREGWEESKSLDENFTSAY